MDYSNNFQENNTSNKFCESIFDGILEWPVSKAGELVVIPCPGLELEKNATKQCMDNGEWYINPQINKTWTNYTDCWSFYNEESAIIKINSTFLENIEIYQTWFPIMKIVSHIGYCVSLFFLIISLLIFANIKRLRCSRNKLHMHLFFSFIMRAVTYLLKEYLFIEGVALSSDLVTFDGKLKYIRENYGWICKAIISSRNYFIIANYMLILMEGVYLNQLMFLTLSNNRHRLVYYCLLGWGVPGVLIFFWITLKVQYSDNLCWTLTDIYYYIFIKYPITIIVIINFILFIIILRLLYGKINSMNIREKRERYRRLTRSTLTLVLLLGIPYTVSEIVSFTTNQILEVIWIFCDQTFTAFQGFIVALMYCLLNAEVQAEIKLKKIMYNGRRQCRSRTISHTQQSTIPFHEDMFEYPKLDVYWHRERNSEREITFDP